MECRELCRAQATKEIIVKFSQVATILSLPGKPMTDSIANAYGKGVHLFVCDDAKDCRSQQTLFPSQQCQSQPGWQYPNNLIKSLYY